MSFVLDHLLSHLAGCDLEDRTVVIDDAKDGVVELHGPLRRPLARTINRCRCQAGTTNHRGGKRAPPVSGYLGESVMACFSAAPGHRPLEQIGLEATRSQSTQGSLPLGASPSLRRPKDRTPVSSFRHIGSGDEQIVRLSVEKGAVSNGRLGAEDEGHDAAARARAGGCGGDPPAGQHLGRVRAGKTVPLAWVAEAAQGG